MPERSRPYAQQQFSADKREPLKISGELRRREFLTVLGIGALVLAHKSLPRFLENLGEDVYQPGVQDILPSEETELIPDTLEYFITKHLDTGLTGTHYLGQTLDGFQSYYEKFNDPKSFEYHIWDDNYLRLKVDHSDPKHPYRLENGVWMKRRMRVGERQHVNDYIEWFDGDCNLLERKPFIYDVILENHFPGLRVGKLPPQDVIVLKYQPFAPQGNIERDYYSREWGWVRWELYDNTDQHLVDQATFDRVAGKLREPARELVCKLPSSEQIFP